MRERRALIVWMAVAASMSATPSVAARSADVEPPTDLVASSPSTAYPTTTKTIGSSHPSSATFVVTGPDERGTAAGPGRTTPDGGDDAAHSTLQRWTGLALDNWTVVPGPPSSRRFRTTARNANAGPTAAHPPGQGALADGSVPIDDYGAVVHASVFFTGGVAMQLTDGSNTSSSNSKPDSLTNLGKKQTYQLGKWLALRYDDLLPEDGQFDSQRVRIDSGLADSVFESAECLLAGLFPPSGAQIWNSALLWQPIPVHSEPVSRDATVGMTKGCRQYDTCVSATNGLPEWTRLFENYEESFALISNNTGFSFSQDNMYNNLFSAFRIYNNLTTQLQFNLSLPEWTKKVYPEPLKTLAAKYLQFCTYTDAMKKFKAGPFLKLLAKDLREVITRTDGLARKLHLYSADAYALSAVLNTLGIYNSLVPPPATALLFELREKNRRHTITVFLKNSTSPPYLLQIQNCEKVCDYAKFIDIVSNYTLTNWDDECNVISFGDLAYSTPLLVAGLVVVIVLIFLCLLLLLKFCKCFFKKKGRISYR